MTEHISHCVFIVVGVCGVGKSSVGRALARNLAAQFIEADEYHSPENVRHMASGLPLTDAMRMPWLARLASAAETARQNGPVVMACSALKRSYRDFLRDHIGRVQIVFLHGEREMIAERLRGRTDHFMPVSLLDSQLATLDMPGDDEDAIAVDVAPPQAVVYEMVTRAARKRFSTS